MRQAGPRLRQGAESVAQQLVAMEPLALALHVALDVALDVALEVLQL
jgi:hypothetical protein